MSSRRGCHGSRRTHPEAQVSAELAQRAFVEEVDAAQDGVVAGTPGRGRLRAAPAAAFFVVTPVLLARLRLRVLRALAVATQRLQLLLILQQRRGASAAAKARMDARARTSMARKKSSFRAARRFNRYSCSRRAATMRLISRRVKRPRRSKSSNSGTISSIRYATVSAILANATPAAQSAAPPLQRTRRQLAERGGSDFGNLCRSPLPRQTSRAHTDAPVLLRGSGLGQAAARQLRRSGPPAAESGASVLSGPAAMADRGPDGGFKAKGDDDEEGALPVPQRDGCRRARWRVEAGLRPGH